MPLTNLAQGVTSTAAGATTDNVLTGNVLAIMPYNGYVRIAVTAEAAGESRVTVFCGSRVVVPECSVSRAARVPILPDDVLITAPVRQGEQVVLKHRNTGAGANSLFWRVDYRSAR